MGKTTGKILIVEDDKFIGRAYKDGLERAGFKVKLVTDGSQVLAALSEFSAELILLDLILPGVDGFEVLETVKNNDQYKHLPIIVLSNLSQESDISRAKNLGAMDFVVKAGFSMNALIEKVTAFFQSQ